MIKDNYLKLLNVICHSEDSYKMDDIEIIGNQMKAFGEYVNSVYNHITQTSIIYALYEGDDLRDKLMQLDKRRRIAHESAIAACSQINRMCEIYNVPKFCPETDDRYIIADFCAQVTVEFFLDGQSKDKNTIDNVIEAMQNSNKSIQQENLNKINKFIENMEL